jgi:hypothetical protein
MVECEDCVHFKRRPGDTPWKRVTGCYHPDLMEQRLSDGYLRAQDIPGNHEKINLRGDCAKFEARPKKAPLVRRVVALLRS